MRIAFVMARPDMTGGCKVIAIYAERLAKRGHQVVVVSTGPRPPSLRMRIRTLLRKRKWIRYQRIEPHHFDGTNIDHRMLERFRPVVEHDVPDADVVIATWWQTAEWVTALSPRKGAKAYFMQDYGAPGMELSDLVPTWHYPLHIITITEALRDLVREHGVEAPVSVVRNSVDTDHFDAEPRGKQRIPTIGFLFRPTWIKGYDIVLEAHRLARRRHPELRLLTYGPDPLEQALPEGVEFRHRPPTNALRHIYGACDAWLFASRREGFGLPLLEAMACRTPVIAVPSGAAPELVAQGGGMMVRPDDPADMAAAIERFVEMSESEWKSYSDKAYATVRGYTWDDAAERFEQALLQAMTRRDAASGS